MKEALHIAKTWNIINISSLFLVAFKNIFHRTLIASVWRLSLPLWSSLRIRKFWTQFKISYNSHLKLVSISFQILSINTFRSYIEIQYNKSQSVHRNSKNPEHFFLSFNIFGHFLRIGFLLLWCTEWLFVYCNYLQNLSLLQFFLPLISILTTQSNLHWFLVKVKF